MKSWKELGGHDRPISVVFKGHQSRNLRSVGGEGAQEGSGSGRCPSGCIEWAGGPTITQNRVGLGYIGIGYADKSVKFLKVNGKTATEASVRDFSWPVARPLFMYTNGKPTGAAAKFIEFMVSARKDKNSHRSKIC